MIQKYRVSCGTLFSIFTISGCTEVERLRAQLRTLARSSSRLSSRRAQAMTRGRCIAECSHDNT